DNPDALGIRLWVNGELRQHNNTANCVRGVARLIAEISEFMTLHAGDVLITGTPEGRVDVLPGDRVTVEIDGLGQLTNPIVAEQGLAP
ncbi:MAG: fumarylacetoacetate hydrolase family protein, partial [Pseudomonas sp.]|nr:fumarylacetoacetate hydrolase family protein [Pseudomonas sp.]